MSGTSGTPSVRNEKALLIVLADLTRFMVNSRGTLDATLAELLDGLAATLPARTVSLSAEAFRCLGNGERKPFKKHTSPVVYIPVDDPRP
jgi:hypothetical protein